MPKTLATSATQPSFDSNTANSGPLLIPADSAWHRVLTLAPGVQSEHRFDIAVSAGTVNLRLTRASLAGQTHTLFQTDLTQVNKYIPSSSSNGPGTVNQPQAGAIVGLNVNPQIGAEIGIEAQQVSGSPTVRVYGSAQT